MGGKRIFDKRNVAASRLSFFQIRCRKPFSSAANWRVRAAKSASYFYFAKSPAKNAAETPAVSPRRIPAN